MFKYELMYVINIYILTYNAKHICVCEKRYHEDI
jgi:hypothetical protein